MHYRHEDPTGWRGFRFLRRRGQDSCGHAGQAARPRKGIDVRPDKILIAATAVLALPTLALAQDADITPPHAEIGYILTTFMFLVAVTLLSVAIFLKPLRNEAENV